MGQSDRQIKSYEMMGGRERKRGDRGSERLGTEAGNLIIYMNDLCESNRLICHISQTVK